MEIFTDGGCIGNPGPGAWAYYIIHNEKESSGSGYEEQTTNNRMELTAVISALKKVQSDFSEALESIDLHTDSQYVQKGITSWISTWERNGWQTAAKKPVKNRDLWVELKKLSDKIRPEWHWVKGHAGNDYNEKCDSLVQKTIKENQK